MQQATTGVRQFSSKGFTGRPATGTTAAAGAAGGQAPQAGKKPGNRPTHNIKVKDDATGKYVSVGAIFENKRMVADKETGEQKEVLMRTLTVKENLQPGVFYSVFENTEYKPK